MSEENIKTPRKSGKLDYIKAVFLSAIIVGVVTFSNEKLTFQQTSEPPPIYSSEDLIGNWNQESGKMEFKTNGLCKVEKMKKPLLILKTKENNFSLFKFGRDKKGNKTGTIAYHIEVTDPQTMIASNGKSLTFKKDIAKQ
jgi:hypothetical protein